MHPLLILVHGFIYKNYIISIFKAKLDVLRTKSIALLGKLSSKADISSSDCDKIEKNLKKLIKAFEKSKILENTRKFFLKFCLFFRISYFKEFRFNWRFKGIL